MNRKPVFRFAVNSAPHSAQAVAELAQKLEASGFSSLLAPDGPSHAAAVFPLLSLAASATTTLRVGNYVIANDLHHPFHLAHNAATMNTLFGGRFELGLGAGRPGAEAEYSALGLQIGSPGARLNRLERSANVIQALLRGETVAENGPDYQMTDARLPDWLTVQPPPKMVIAGVGPRLVEMAARTADIVAVGIGPFDSWDAVRTKFDRIEEVGRERERKPEVNMTLNGAGSILSGWFSQMPAEERESLFKADAPGLLWGSVDEMVEGIRRRYEELGVSYFVIMEDLIDTMIPVVKRLAS